MKKKHILILLLSLALFAAHIVPPLVTRVTYEQKHTGYVAAIELTDTLSGFDNQTRIQILKAYKTSGITTAALHIRQGNIDTDLLTCARDAALDTALVLYADNAYTDAFLLTLDRVVQTYNTKYLLLKNAKENADVSPLKALVAKHKLTLVLCENESQLSNESPQGTEACIRAAGGKLLRCYETKKAPGGDADTVFYQMLNSARDRNTEFLLINQRTDLSHENASATQNAVKKFCAWMARAGYTPGVKGTLQGYTVNTRATTAAAAALSMLMLLYMLRALFKGLPAYTDWILLGIAAIAYGAVWVLPEALAFILPTLFAPLGACFCFTLTMQCAESLKDRKGSLIRMLSCLAIALISLLCCSAVLAAMLGGPEYYLNIRIFRGVRLSLILPVLYAFVFLLLRSNPETINLEAMKKNFSVSLKKHKLLYVLIFILALGALAIYLMRSGNTTISPTEKAFRNLMAEFSMARPRTKEFLIGWPALALFAYCAVQNKCKFLTWVSSLASSILFASVMNTFCHVFADVTTSLLRTINGFIFAIPLILIALAITRILLRMATRNKLDKI